MTWRTFLESDFEQRDEEILIPVTVQSMVGSDTMVIDMEKNEKLIDNLKPSNLICHYDYSALQ